MYVKQLENQLIVSCQALEDEPLYSSEIMAKMALAAVQGGAKGIRANSVADIKAIKNQVNVPIIGLIKQDYEDSDVYITPTKKEVKALLEVGADIIAMDATMRKRPRGESLEDIMNFIKMQSNTEIMADISTVEEAKYAAALGFDCVSTTLVGYTPETKGQHIAANHFQLLHEIRSAVSIPVIAEGKISTPETALKALEHGAFFVVVGSAITRPQLITRSFADIIQKYSSSH
ncbi:MULTISPECIES: N-acetylmannosamine-6-phosphate 2-epimerase [Clostridia]|uniref:N-acetylmannosamine-6-phosphate 2-epimerase n=1 Tax=Clostridia TaxID=186801 RepID=UPI000EA38E1C|nr:MULTISPECIES: N-acetylmannosamine-6-phosphate 2-epimerase [Clostridia]NBJ68792.1 N-acetylmannosamine-6-phosphate 2-epimerase [Roseburia sp. 1XD42-34]RKI80171.1 N-acetylmannosamine-6-phosphate 2-epimerase [Clostridium sp. 1xD42-85]